MKARRLIVRLLEKQFSGELDLLTSHSTMVHECTGQDNTLLRVPRIELQRLMRSRGAIATLAMQAIILRRQGLLEDDSISMIVFAEIGKPETVLLQRFLTRNGYPHRIMDANG